MKTLANITKHPREMGFIDVTHTIEKCVDTPNKVERESWEKMGQFNENNGVLAVVGTCLPNVYIKRYSVAAEQELLENGYIQGGMYVPHSNDCGEFMSRAFPRK